VQILAVVGLDPTDTTVTLAAGANEWQLNLYAPGSKFAVWFATGVRPVTIGGRPGYYGPSSLIRARLASVSSTPPRSPAPGSTPAGTSANERRSVAWRYVPSGWSLLQPLGPTSGPMSTLALARSLDFARITAMRSEFALQHAPVGMHLIDWSSTYQLFIETAPVSGVGGRTTEAIYGPSGSGNRVDISIGGSPRTGVSASTTSTRPRDAIVNGRRVTWRAKSDTVSIKFGARVYLYISGLAGTGNVPGTMSKAQLIAIASTITVTTTPSRPQHWFDAKTALP
jgi:hypothetical protein